MLYTFLGETITTAIFSIRICGGDSRSPGFPLLEHVFVLYLAHFFCGGRCSPGLTVLVLCRELTSE